MGNVEQEQKKQHEKGVLCFRFRQKIKDHENRDAVDGNRPWLRKPFVSHVSKGKVKSFLSIMFIIVIE
jgi:hypothetical protein